MYNYDPKLIGTLDIASTYANHCKHQHLTPLHIVYGMAKNPSLKCYHVLKNKLDNIEADLAKIPSVTSSSNTSLTADNNLQKWLQAANSEATQNASKEITENHLLLTIPASIKTYFADIDVKSFNTTSSDQVEKPDFLIDLNQRCKEGKIDPVIGRQKEIRAVLEVLDRRSKNNPILLGEAGVGKTAVIEGLANLIVNKEVPEKFLNKTIYSLDISGLMAGTKFRGDFEQRIQNLIKFIDDQHGNGIVFFDEIHTLIGSGNTSGAIDGANLLKPALARGQLKCIGATTHDEYQKFIMSDSALDRRFRPIIISEPSSEAAIEILIGLRNRFEAHHGISIDDEAIYSAVFLSEQYIQHKKLPDKAIDLIDEACSSKKFSIESMSNDLIELETQLDEKKTLSKTEKSSDSLLEEIKTLEQDFNQRKQLWLSQVKHMQEFGSLKKHLDQLKLDCEQARKNGDFERASKLKFADIPAIEKKLSEYNVSSTLNKVDIAQVLSRQTNIPVEKILASKQEKILQLESFLKTRVFGQDHALEQIAQTLNISYAGLGDNTRPLCSFLLKGPSGVGKTATAKAISEFFFNRNDLVITIDLSEYSEKHSISKLIGAPAGYIGYDQGGQLTDQVRQRPYSIILFDELEKAHEDFGDILLQILDEGRLTDNKARTVSFHNTCVFLTTNAKNPSIDFKPEVLGRLDGIIEYNHLDKKANRLLIAKELDKLNQHLLSRKITISLSDQLIDVILEHGFSNDYGARPLKNYFRSKVIKPLAVLLLSGKLEKGDIKLDLDNSLNPPQVILVRENQ